MKILSLILLLLCALVFAEETPVVTGARIVDYGVYSTQQTGDEDAPNTSAGFIHLTHERLDPALLKQTADVEGRVGVHFGFRFELAGSPKLAAVSIHVKVTHPGIKNPESGKLYTVDEWDAMTNIGIPRFTGWAFDQPYEVAPGEWKIQLLRGEKVLVEKTFRVEKATKGE